jgi:hypothetical protein
VREEERREKRGGDRRRIEERTHLQLWYQSNWKMIALEPHTGLLHTIEREVELLEILFGG